MISNGDSNSIPYHVRSYGHTLFMFILHHLLFSACPGQGLTQVIEKAETSLGIPSPTELSAKVEEEEKHQGETYLSVEEKIE